MPGPVKESEVWPVDRNFDCRKKKSWDGDRFIASKLHTACFSPLFLVERHVSTHPSPTCMFLDFGRKSVEKKQNTITGRTRKLYKRPEVGSNPEPSSCEVTALISAACNRLEEGQEIRVFRIFTTYDRFYSFTALASSISTMDDQRGASH